MGSQVVQVWIKTNLSRPWTPVWSFWISSYFVFVVVSLFLCFFVCSFVFFEYAFYLIVLSVPTQTAAVTFRLSVLPWSVNGFSLLHVLQNMYLFVIFRWSFGVVLFEICTIGGCKSNCLQCILPLFKLFFLSGYYYYYYYFFLLTVKFRKPWTLEILIKCYCVSSKTPITRENNLEAVKKISLWFHLTSDWLLHNGNCQNLIKVFSVFGFAQ